MPHGSVACANILHFLMLATSKEHYTTGLNNSINFGNDRPRMVGKYVGIADTSGKFVFLTNERRQSFLWLFFSVSTF